MSIQFPGSEHTQNTAGVCTGVPHVDINTLVFLVFKQFKKTLPVMGQVSKKPTVDRIRAIPAQAAKRKYGIVAPAQFSTVLAHSESLENAGYEPDQTSPLDGTYKCISHVHAVFISVSNLAGMTVAQVRVIFQYSAPYDKHVSHPLTYVE